MTTNEFNIGIDHASEWI